MKMFSVPFLLICLIGCAGGDKEGELRRENAELKDRVAVAQYQKETGSKNNPPYGWTTHSKEDAEWQRTHPNGPGH